MRLGESAHANHPQEIQGSWYSTDYIKYPAWGRKCVWENRRMPTIHKKYKEVGMAPISFNIRPEAGNTFRRIGA